MPSIGPRLMLVLPLVLAIVSFVLSSLCLFAGHERGVLEDYDIVRLNTSGLGQNLVNLDSDDSSSDNNDDDGDGGFLDTIGDTASDLWNSVEEEAEDILNDVTGGIADVMADALGISEWYSLHVLTYCQGQYSPNATAADGLNVTECSDSMPNNPLNLTEILDYQLSVGPFEASLADINWPDEVQEAIDLLNAALLALFVLYVLTMAFTGLLIIGTITAIFLLSRAVILTNMVFAAIAMLMSVGASIVVTVVMTYGVDELNDAGEEIGLEGYRGDGFLALTWVVSAFMIVTFCVFFTQCCIQRRQRKRERRVPVSKEGGY